MQFIVVCVFVFVIGRTVWGQQCGEVASPNKIHQTPWLVYLDYYRRGVRWDIRCGGTLISPRHVLTAAHCAKKIGIIQMMTRLGEYDVSTKIDCVDGVCSDEVVKVKVAEVIVHPGYDKTEHDIAILKLEKDAPYTDFIRPICLPTGEIQDTTTFVASGWGEVAHGTYSQTTKNIHLPLFPTDQCRNAYPGINLAKNILCAGGEEGVDTCRGDSGGPLALVRNNVELWGVVSAGYNRCGTKGKPGIYTSVKDHLEWIREVIGEK